MSVDSLLNQGKAYLCRKIEPVSHFGDVKLSYFSDSELSTW